MIKLIYSIPQEQKVSEVKWLREQKIFPGVDDFFDWRTGKAMTHIGVIVSSESALAIKLRHKLDLQDEYRQK